MVDREAVVADVIETHTPEFLTVTNTIHMACEGCGWWSRGRMTDGGRHEYYEHVAAEVVKALAKAELEERPAPPPAKRVYDDEAWLEGR